MFAVWGQVLEADQVLDRVVEPTEGVFVWVNGRLREEDARSVPIDDLNVIEIQVGTSPFQPLDYEFPAAFD